MQECFSNNTRWTRPLHRTGLKSGLHETRGVGRAGPDACNHAHAPFGWQWYESAAALPRCLCRILCQGVISTREHFKDDLCRCLGRHAVDLTRAIGDPAIVPAAAAATQQQQQQPEDAYALSVSGSDSCLITGPYTV